MKRTPIRRVSAKRGKRLKEYSKLRKDYLEAHRCCELCKNAEATQIHHKNKRFGSRLNDVTQWMAVCFLCHDWIENNKKEAEKIGAINPSRNRAATIKQP